jgi:hypothetical protein
MSRYPLARIMSETQRETPSPSVDDELTESESAILQSVTNHLDQDAEILDIYEGEMSGNLYISTEPGYQRVTVSRDGLLIQEVSTTNERLEPVARIEPNEGETVEDAVNALSFAGD